MSSRTITATRVGAEAVDVPPRVPVVPGAAPIGLPSVVEEDARTKRKRK